MKSESQQLISELADSLRPSIEHLESMHTSSRNNLYRTFLAKNPADKRWFVAAAMIEAGANRDGVVEAMVFLGQELEN